MKKFGRACALVALAVAALSMVVMAGCSVSGSYTIDGGKVEANGKVLTVTLESNPTTGYQWAYSISGTSLENTEETYETTTTSGAVTGSSSNQIYVFEGNGAGTSTITLTYARSWETTSADKTVVIEVTTDSSSKITNTKTSIDGKVVGQSSGFLTVN